MRLIIETALMVSFYFTSESFIRDLTVTQAKGMLIPIGITEGSAGLSAFVRDTSG